MRHPITYSTTTTPGAPSTPATWPEYHAIRAAFAAPAATPEVNVQLPTKRPARPRLVAFGDRGE